ncbi:tyrosine-type recombinase/integrase [Sandaracinus amylolyticus]|uniref:tyrosine-type recombinase/integrase n=1 Tax=Sandaracinus amylolyticus TaxID=927083 RepID=UPI00069D7439|nr:site-specific integrase [Sandaracinus amylolyticus]
MPLPDLSIESFRSYVLAVRSKNTAIKYAQAASRFMLFCAQHQLEMSALPPGAIRLFAEHLLHAGMKPASVKTMAAGAKRYLEWCADKGQSLPVLGRADIPRRHGPPPNALSGETLLAYLALASRVHEPVRTALLLLPYSGLRTFEAASLELGHLSKLTLPVGASRGASGSRPQEMIVISVNGKGGKHRVVPLLLDGKPLLLAYLRGWRRRQSGKWLFPMPGGGHVATRTLRHHVKLIRERISEALGRYVRLTPRTLRRTYLTTLYRHGIDVPTLTKIAGHESVQTTMDHYLEIQVQDVANATSGARLVAKGAREELVSRARASVGALLAQTAEARVLTVPPPDDDPDDEHEEEDE